MTTYYRLPTETQQATLVELTPEQYAALQENGKAANLRLWVVDAQPTPSATQVVVNAGIVVGEIEAHQTWTLRDKTATELEDDALAEELAQLDTLLANIDTQNAITNAAFNAMTTAQKFDVLRADRNHLLRAAKFLLRRAKRGV
jgi:hypothetical protein